MIIKMTEVEFTGTPVAVYRLYAADGALLYVGITANLAQRMAQHQESQPWWALVARKTMAWYPDRPAAVAAEALAIRSETPYHNVIVPSDGERRDRWRHQSPLLAWHPSPPELGEWVRAEAERRGVTISVILNEALEAYRKQAQS